MKLDHYIKISELFQYPGEELTQTALDFKKTVSISIPGCLEEYQIFLKAIQALNFKQQQEYYMKTFDVQAICHLDIGYLIFGEDYKRAQLLVNLQNEHLKAGIDCGSELGDHLPNVLKLLASTTDKEFLEELGFIITSPAVRFMISKFKDSDNYYKHLLEVLSAFLLWDFKGEGLAKYAFPEEALNGDNEFIMPSAKSDICQSHCKSKNF